MLSKRLSPFLICAAFGIGLSAAPQAFAKDPTKGVCLFSRDVDHVQMLDKKHILFFMSDGQVWENTLFKECYTLHPGADIDWGQDYWHIAVCSWPVKPPLLPVKSERNPPDTAPWTSVVVKLSREHCALGQFTPYSPVPAN